MRVALVCPYSLSRWGGVQGQVVGLAAALVDAGHRVTVLAPLDGPPPGIGDGTVAVVGLGRSVPVRANGSVAPVALSPVGARRAVSALRGGGFDVVHLHEPFAPGPNYACLLACRVPMVGTFHRSGGSAAYTVLGPLARVAARRLRLRTAVSEAAAATARHALGGTYEIVGNGVDFARFEEASPWPTSAPTVLFVGRHEERKGLRVLLEAFAQVKRPDAVLWVAGSGPQSDELRRRSAGDRRVEWIGSPDDDELAGRIAGAHVVCTPSLGGESFGVVLLEAMAARTAIVASDIPGYAAVAGGHAELVPPGDVPALAEGLGRVLDEVVAGTGRGSPAVLAAAAGHAAQWSMTAVAGRYARVYERAVGRG